MVNENWILTAAHCFTYIKRPEQLLIQSGSNKLYPEHPIHRKIAKIIKHVGYNPTVAVHDIALLKLKEPILKHNNFKAVKLMSENNFILTNSLNAILLGWGLERTDGMLQAQLQKVELHVLSASNCRSKLPAFVHAQNLCAFSEYKGQCNGDSGGPLLFDGLQIGIVSWSLKPCGFYPGVFTNLSFYITWINETITNE